MKVEEKKFSYGERMTAMMLASWWIKLSNHLDIETTSGESFHPNLILQALSSGRDELIEIDYHHHEVIQDISKPEPQYTVIAEMLETIIYEEPGGMFPPFTGISDDEEADKLAKLVACRVISNPRNINYHKPKQPLAVWQRLSDLIYNDYGTEEANDEWQQFMNDHFGGYKMGNYSS
jgi:hypothetical protein